MISTRRKTKQNKTKDKTKQEGRPEVSGQNQHFTPDGSGGRCVREGGKGLGRGRRGPQKAGQPGPLGLSRERGLLSEAEAAGG